MPTFRLRFRDGRIEDVEGDDTSTEASGTVCVYRDVLVAGRPRRIVARRVPASAGLVAMELL